MMEVNDYESDLLECIRKIGLEEICSKYNEGRERNEYYRFTLVDGSVRYLINPSEWFKGELGIE